MTMPHRFPPPAKGFRHMDELAAVGVTVEFLLEDDQVCWGWMESPEKFWAHTSLGICRGIIEVKPLGWRPIADARVVAA